MLQCNTEDPGNTVVKQVLSCNMMETTCIFTAMMLSLTQLTQLIGYKPDPLSGQWTLWYKPEYRYQHNSCDQLLPIQIEQACVMSAVDGVFAPQKSNTVVLYTEKQIQA